MFATVRVAALLSAVAFCVATPYYLPQHQQRQLFYSVVPPYTQYAQYSAPVAPAPLHYRQIYYAPQAAANLVAPVPSALRYPGPLVAPAKQVLYYPGASPYPGNFLLAGDEASEENPSNSWTSWFASLPFASFISGSQPASPDTSPAAGAEGGSAGASPSGEKVEQPSNSEQPTKEKEEEAEKPAEEAKVKGVPQKYVLVGHPQFYGNFGLQRLNPAAVIPSADRGAVSSYLLLKNYPGVKFNPQVPQVHQIPQQASDAELIPAGQPGSAALGYQRLLQAAQIARQQKEYEDNASVVVEAPQRDAIPEENKPASEAEKETEDEETGTNE